MSYVCHDSAEFSKKMNRPNYEASDQEF